MALSTLIRKASSSAALRVVGSSITTFNHSISRSFSSAETARDLADANLDAVLERQINIFESNLKNLQVNTLPDSLPYKIDRMQDWVDELTLFSKFHDDKDITIGIHWSKFSTKELETKTPTIPMEVTVDKNDAVRFQIIASPEDIVIQSLSVFDEKDGNDINDIGILNLELKDLNYEFQRSLYKYLEFKGINSDMAKFVIKALIMKKKENELMALKSVKEVSQK